MRVLLIEDDDLVARSIALLLGTVGFVTAVTGLAEDGIALAMRGDYDVIVLDLNLPDFNGQHVIEALRGARIATPILVLSGEENMRTRVAALGAGADDFVTKPFHKDELIARLETVVRRANAHVRSSITIGDLVVDRDTRTASARGERLALTTKEYQMLEILCLRKGCTLSKDMLLSHLYGGKDEPDQKIIDVFVCKLRKKIAQATDGELYIRTIWGRGYRVSDPVEAAA